MKVSWAIHLVLATWALNFQLGVYKNEKKKNSIQTCKEPSFCFFLANQNTEKIRVQNGMEHTWPPKSQKTSFALVASILPMLRPTVGTILSGGSPSIFE